MKRKINELSLYEITELALLNLKIDYQVQNGIKIYTFDDLVLSRDLILDRNMEVERLGLLLSKVVNLNYIIQNFLVSICVDEFVLGESYIYRATCLGSKWVWESTNLVHACLMAVVSWYVNNKIIEVDEDSKKDSDGDCQIYIEALNLPILLALKLKKMNVKTISDLKMLKDESLLNELKKYEVFSIYIN